MRGGWAMRCAVRVRGAETRHRARQCVGRGRLRLQQRGVARGVIAEVVGVRQQREALGV